MAYRERRLEEDIRFLTLANDHLSKEVQFLHEQVRYTQELNHKFLIRLGVIDRIKVEMSAPDFTPIGGFTSLRSKIAEKERLSRDEYLAEQEKANKSNAEV